MTYHIAVDSCTDPMPGMREDNSISFVPLTLFVGEKSFIDDESFDQKEFLKTVAESSEGPTSACPSPQDFIDAYGDDSEDAYGITLSAELSGSYNSAVLGANLLAEKYPDKNIHVFNSRSACCGQTLILLKLKECLNAKMSFHQTVKEVEQYISEQTTLFVLETLEHLYKNGRLNHLEIVLANALNIKPVMSSTPEGSIEKVGIQRGIKKALIKMVERIESTVINPAEKILAITHCNCPERAAFVKERIMSKYNFKDVIIVDAAGVASLYAGDGGIVIAY